MLTVRGVVDVVEVAVKRYHPQLPSCANVGVHQLESSFDVNLRADDGSAGTHVRRWRRDWRECARILAKLGDEIFGGIPVLTRCPECQAAVRGHLPGQVQS